MKNKIKAIFAIALIYVPIIFFVWYLNSLFTNLVFDGNINLLHFFSGSILLKIIWIYIQAIVYFFYYRCFIGIHKLLTNNKDLFLK